MTYFHLLWMKVPPEKIKSFPKVKIYPLLASVPQTCPHYKILLYRTNCLSKVFNLLLHHLLGLHKLFFGSITKIFKTLFKYNWSITNGTYLKWFFSQFFFHYGNKTYIIFTILTTLSVQVNSLENIHSYAITSTIPFPELLHHPKLPF